MNEIQTSIAIGLSCLSAGFTVGWAVQYMFGQPRPGLFSEWIQVTVQITSANFQKEISDKNKRVSELELELKKAGAVSPEASSNEML